MQDRLRYYLIGITLFAVVSDTMLYPFYPRFFQDVFGITSPNYVGTYLACMTLVVMLAFPFWARLAKRVGTLTLLIYTQAVAGMLSILCYFSSSIEMFWLISLTMVTFKASYLLVYPYIMSREDASKHTNTAGLLSVIVHFGAIGGASAGGFFLGLVEPQKIFLIMSLSDFSQIVVCLYIRSRQNAERGSAAEETVKEKALQTDDNGRYRSLLGVLAMTMLVFYFSAQLTRPFFAVYWEAVSGINSPVIAGLAFAIPAWIALLALWLNHHLSDRNLLLRLTPSLLLGCCGLLIQSYEQTAMVVLGRCLYGWALFQATVKLDVLLYKLSTPEHYATDFSKIHIFQSLGTLLASLCAGALVSVLGLSAPLVMAAAGFAATLALLTLLKPQEAKVAAQTR